MLAHSPSTAAAAGEISKIEDLVNYSLDANHVLKHFRNFGLLVWPRRSHRRFSCPGHWSPCWQSSCSPHLHGQTMFACSATLERTGPTCRDPVVRDEPPHAGNAESAESREIVTRPFKPLTRAPSHGVWPLQP